MKKFLGKKISILLTLLLSSTVFLSGCGGNSSSSDKKDLSQKKDLIVAIQGDAKSIDPHGAGDANSVNALNGIFETLVKYDEKGEIVPSLAESWEQIDDLSYKFNLRKGVKFHNGEEMKASDVVFSFKRALTPVGSKVQYIMNAIDGDGLEIVDDYTLIVRTKKPFSPLISYLPYIGASVLSEKYYTENPDTAPMNPVGTGPLKFVEWKKGSELTYTRNEEYWGDKTKYETLVMKIIPENNSRMIELETGAIDIALGVSPNDYQRIKDSKDMELLTKPSTQFTQLAMNTQKAPLNDVRVRQAIDLAINEESVVQSVHRGSVRYTPGGITPDQQYFDDSDTKCKYDVEKAKSLIKEAGLAPGTKLTFYTTENQVRIDTGTIIQTQLKEIGIDLEIKVLEAATFYDAVQNGEHDLCISGWGAIGFKDPDNNLYGPLHSDQIPDNNYCFYSNPELDKLLDLQRTLPNGPEREKAVKDAQKLIRQEVPYITFDNPDQAVGVRSYVKGFSPTPAASHFYNSVYFE